MKVFISGATGFVGSRLVCKLAEQGHEIVISSRDKVSAQLKFNFPVKVYEWAAPHGDCPAQAVADVDAVINLMGENISAGRWSDGQKKKMEESRVISTRKIVEAVNLRQKELDVFIQASAIGYYPINTGVIDEKTSAGATYLSKLCQSWENEIASLTKVKRTLTTRIGVVLGEEGGALSKLMPIFKLGAGGPIGNGKMMMSWIHVDDLVKVFSDALKDDKYKGIINAVAPDLIDNSRFTKALAKGVSRPAFFPVPPFVLKIVYGEMSTIMLDGQEIKSRLSAELNHQFLYPTIDEAINEIVKKKISDKSNKEIRHSRFLAYQFVPKELDEIFNFFENPYNLEKITPPFVGFKIVSKTPTKVEKGLLIDYKLKIHGFPAKWKTLIKEHKKNDYFIDVQLKGPYKSWHHTHSFYSVPGGTLLKDEVLFALPFGDLGELVAGSFIRKDVSKIFEYRKKVIEKEFNKSGQD